jgi:ankyrin repeat protein
MEYVVILGASGLLAYLIANGRAADVNSLNSRGTPMLHLAVQHLNVIILDQLLQAGVEVNALDSQDNTALHRAILSGATNTAYHLLRANIAVNARNSDGNTALHLAIAETNEAVMLLLFGFDHILYRQHVELNIINNMGQSPLHLAILTHNIDAIDILFRHGADIHLTNNNFAHVPSPNEYFIALYGHDRHMMNYWEGLTNFISPPLHTSLPPLQINTSSIDEEDPFQMPPFLGMMNSFFHS